MFKADTFIKQLRKKENLSQRKLAQISGISYRQIQRIEQAKSGITLGKLESIIEKFGLELKTSAIAPDWNALFYFGMPLNVSGNPKRKYRYNTIVRNIYLASEFLFENKYNAVYARHYDSFKALLLALKTHYPSKFNEIKNKYKTDFPAFDLFQLQGRHIKLRNICLSRLAIYFSNTACNY